MRKIFLSIVIILSLLISLVGGAEAKVRVRGHTKRDGSYVAPHYRTNPNKTKLDNWSTKGNFNPYTGKKGNVSPYRRR